MSLPPTNECFWAEPGRLLAGKYPGAWHDPTAARATVDAILGAGVSLFLDLTEAGELPPYADLLHRRGRHLRRPIRDMSACSEADLVLALDAIDDELFRGGVVYVHCWGGCGRTGMVVSAWWVRHGVEPSRALARYARRCGAPCPETAKQRALVLGWSGGR
jgi:hypothetical protein